MLLLMGIGLFTSRIMLDALGVVDYGLYNVVGSVVLMLVFLNVAMTSSTQRFLSVELGKRNVDRLQKTFSISLIIHGWIALIVALLCETVGLWFLYNKINIPSERFAACLYVFQFSILTTILTVINVPYNALIISHEKMNAFAYISMVDVILKLLVCYALYLTGTDRLVVYAFLIMLIQIVDRILYWAYCRKHFPESRFVFVRHDRLYKEMLSFALWALLGQFAYVCNTAGLNLMLNIFFSPVINAARGISVQVSNAVQQFSSNFQLSVEPQITKSYAAREKERTYLLIENSSRFSIYLLALISLPIIIKMDAILAIWLVEVPEYTAIFVILSLITGIFGCVANPLNMAINSNGKVKIPGIVAGVLLILILPVSYLFLLFNYPPYIVFLVQLVITIILNFFRLLMAHYYCGVSIGNYMMRVVLIPFCVLTLSVVLPYLWSMTLGKGNSFCSIATTTIVSVFSVSLVVYVIGTTKSEKKILTSFIKNKIKY